MQVEDFEQAVWKYTDVYDKNVLVGPVTFSKLRGLWKLGRIGPGTTVSSEVLLHHKSVAIKRVKGMMTALSRKDEDLGGEAGVGTATYNNNAGRASTARKPEHRRRRGESERDSTSKVSNQPSTSTPSLFSPGKVFYSQLWYCQMPNGDVVGPLKTKTLYNLWMTGKVGAHFLVRAKTAGAWPSDRTYTVEGLMQALQLLHPEMRSFIPDIPASLGTPRSSSSSKQHQTNTNTNSDSSRRGVSSSSLGIGGHHSARRRETPKQIATSMEERLPPGSIVREVVVTLAEDKSKNRPNVIEAEPSPSSSSSSAESYSSYSSSVSKSISISSPSEASSDSFSLLVPVERERETTTRRRRRGGSGASSSAQATNSNPVPNGTLDLDNRLEEAKTAIARLEHRLEQSEKEKIQAREVALSLRTMLVEHKKQTQTKGPKLTSTSLPRSPLVENSMPEQSLELRKLSDMSTDNLYSYANSLRAENEKLQTMRKEIVNVHRGSSSGASALRHEEETTRRTFTPVPFDISDIPLSARNDGSSRANTNIPLSKSTMGKATAGTVEDSMGFVSIPPAPRETYQSSTKSVHAESLAGPASSPYNGMTNVNGRSQQQNRRESYSEPCECVSTDPVAKPFTQQQSLGSLEDEREIDLFLTPREDASTSRTKQQKEMTAGRGSSGVSVPQVRKAEESFTFHHRRESEDEEEVTKEGGGSSSEFAAIDALQKKVEALSRSVEKSKMQTRNLQHDLEESRDTAQKKWSKDVNPHPTRYQARSKQIDEHVELVCDRFKNDGFHLPLTYTEGFGYSLGGKKIHLAVFGTKLNIRFGGGYILFMDYLSQKKVPLQELGRGRETQTEAEAGAKDVKSSDSELSNF